MDSEDCLNKFKEAKTFYFATVDRKQAPQVRPVSTVWFDDKDIYFLTAKGKYFRDQLLSGKVQILSIPSDNESVRASGKAEELQGEELDRMRSLFFNEFPYLKDIYPGDASLFTVIFKLSDYGLEYFRLDGSGVRREFHKINDGNRRTKGYAVVGNCIGCGNCARACPQKAIDVGSPVPFLIRPNKCINCGICFEICPLHAIMRYEI